MGGHGLWVAKAGASMGVPLLTLLLLLLMLRGVFVLLDVELGRFFWLERDTDVSVGGLDEGVVGGSSSSWSSESSFAGAGAAMDMASRSRQMQPAGVALHPFVMFSAYRMDATTLYVLGLASRLVRDFAKPVFQCDWHPLDADGATPSPHPQASTRARVLEGSTDWGHMPYTETILECRFPRPVGADAHARGGALRLVIKAAPEAGETATLRVAKAQVAVASLEALREPPAGYNHTAAATAQQQTRRFKYAFCSAPISGGVRAAALRPWFVYHLHLLQAAAGDAHFFLYNVGGLDARARAVLAPLQDAGLVTVWDVMQQPLFPAWWTSQILFMDDCVHRHRHSADWVLFHDFDEYLYVAPPLTLPQLLATHADAPVVTWGSWEIDVESCAPLREEEHLWPLHRMRWRMPRPECRDKVQPDPYMCTGSLARRKYALNPRKEISVVVHYTLGQAYTQARHLHAAVARIEHYRSVFSVDRVPCSHIREPGARVAKEPKRHSWSVLEMDCAVCPLLPEAVAYFEAMFNSTQQGRAFARDFLAKSRSLAD